MHAIQLIQCQNNKILRRSMNTVSAHSHKQRQDQCESTDIASSTHVASLIHIACKKSYTVMI